MRLKEARHIMNRNHLYLVIGALTVAVVVLSYLFYQERQKTTGVDITVGKSGISIEAK
jgi:RsiW-degrading membrane proteinase PrsW (M82 family)